MPRSLSRYTEHTQAVTEVCGKAGDCVIFTETCSHGTLPWRAKHQRRALLYKMSPGFQSYGPAAEFGEPAGQYGKSAHTVEYPEYVREMPEEQARVMMAPHVRRDAGAAADIRRLSRL